MISAGHSLPVIPTRCTAPEGPQSLRTNFLRCGAGTEGLASFRPRLSRSVGPEQTSRLYSPAPVCRAPHAAAVGFPGHFLVRLERNEAAGEEPGAILVDPFFGGQVLDGEALLKLLRRAAGPNETLRPEYLAAASPRAILVRMLANLKSVHL